MRIGSFCDCQSAKLVVFAAKIVVSPGKDRVISIMDFLCGIVKGV